MAALHMLVNAVRAGVPRHHSGTNYNARKGGIILAAFAMIATLRSGL